MIPSNDVNIEVVDTIVGIVAKGSLLEMQLKHLEIQPNREQLDVSNSTTITLRDCHDIFKNTIGQAETPLEKERQLRLTASNFGKVINRKSECTDSFVQSICNPTNISNSPFVKYGIENEDAVLQSYTKNRCMVKVSMLSSMM